MADQAQSILDRLKAKSKQSNVSFQIILQLFFQEEFLRRLAQSQYANRFILKGGLLLYGLTNFSSRPTVDMDFLIQRLSNEEALMKEIISEIISQNNDFILLEMEHIKSISEHRIYHGLRFQMVGKLKRTSTPFDIDLGVGDVIVPKPVPFSYPTQIDGFDSPLIIGYSLESVIAEKFDAILERMSYTSRMKDFFDIYDLSIRYSFDGRVLQEAITETLRNRRRIYEKHSMQVIESFQSDALMKSKWVNFCKTIQINLPFHVVIGHIITFLGPIFLVILNEDEFFGEWTIDEKWKVNK